MEFILTSVSVLLAVALLWTSGAKLLPSARLATTPEMSWAERPGLASGMIAGVVELLAAALLLLSLAISIDAVVVVVGIGIAAHMAVAATKTEDGLESDETSRIPNWVIAALGLVVAAAAVIA